MSNKREGGPAFPRAAFAPTDVGHEDVGIHDSQEGMSLRDWFAGQALIGLVPFTNAPNGLKPAEIAEAAFKIADAMVERWYET